MRPGDRSHFLINLSLCVPARWDPGIAGIISFYTNTSSQDEKRPTLISLYIEIIIKYVLVCLTFFQKQSTRAAGKKILPKFTNISVYICA